MDGDKFRGNLYALYINFIFGQQNRIMNDIIFIINVKCIYILLSQCYCINSSLSIKIET